MSTYRYTLQPYQTKKSRYTCPSCDAPHKFTRYIDNETNQALADHVGKCDPPPRHCEERSNLYLGHSTKRNACFVQCIKITSSTID